jgi:hypothetical protein
VVATASRGLPERSLAPEDLPIPPELDRFLSVPGPRLVFVRGPEGTGKAAIAARILQRWGGSAVWVGTRGGDYRDPAPGASDPATSVTQVDLSWAGTLTQGTHADLMAARDALGGYYRGRGEVPPSDDWLPPILAAPLRDLPAGTPPTLAIDSWEGFVNRYLDLPGGPPGEVLRSGRVERLLLGLMVARGTRLVAVSEYGDSDILESMADAVLVTAAAELEDRLVRIFSMTKLRGFPVEETVYPYTLDEGRFQFIPRHSTNPAFEAVGAERDPTPNEIDSLWPGSAAFAAAFGRLQVGTVSILESDPSVPEDILRLISAAVFLPVLARGGRVLITLPVDLPPEQLYRALRATRTDEELVQQLRLISPAATVNLPSAARRLLIPLQSTADDSGFIAVPQARRDRPIEPMFPESTRFLQNRNAPVSPNLAIVPIEALQAAARTVGLQYTPEAFAAIVHEDVATRAAHVLVLARAGDPLLESVRSGAQPYLRLVQRQGRLFVFGVRPWTPMYALQPTAHPERGRPFDLIRIS